MSKQKVTKRKPETRTCKNCFEDFDQANVAPSFTLYGYPIVVYKGLCESCIKIQKNIVNLITTK